MKSIYKSASLLLCSMLYLNPSFAKGDVIAVNRSNAYVMTVAVNCRNDYNGGFQLWLYNNGVSDQGSIYRINCKDFYLTAFTADDYGHVSEMFCDTIKVPESNSDKTRYYTVYGKNNCVWS